MNTTRLLFVFLLVAAASVWYQKSLAYLTADGDEISVVDPYKRVTVVCPAGDCFWLLMEDYHKPTVQLKDIIRLVTIANPKATYYFRLVPPTHMPANKKLHWIEIDKNGDKWFLKNRELIGIVNNECKTKDCKIKNVKLDFPWNFVKILNDQRAALLNEQEAKNENKKLEEELKNSEIEDQKKETLCEILEDSDDEKEDDFLNNLPTYNEEEVSSPDK